LKKCSRAVGGRLTIIGTNFVSCHRVTESRTRLLPDFRAIDFRKRGFASAETDKYVFMDS
jgi:hypothetical protein